MSIVLLTALRKKRGSLVSLFLSILLLFAVFSGIAFRFSNLDLKPYWHDEVYTSLRISGYGGQEALNQVSGQVVDARQLFKYQCASEEKSIIDTVRSLYVDDPQHPPLFYVLETIWNKVFGKCSVATTRSLSALFGVFAIPMFYFLVREIFSSERIALLSAAFFSLSPIQIRYSQEARQYSLLLLLIVISSFVLLKALKNHSKLGWALYSFFITLGLYCHLLTLFSMFGHFVIAVSIKTHRRTKNVCYFLAASIFSTILFIPWLLVLYKGQNKATGQTKWLANNLEFGVLIEKWIDNINRVVVTDININIFSTILACAIAVLLIYSAYFLCTRTQKWLVVFGIGAMPILLLLTIDLLRSGQSSTISHYSLISCCVFYISLAYLLSKKIGFLDKTGKEGKIWCVVTVLLIASSIASDIHILKQESWWNLSQFDADSAKIIDNSDRPIVFSDGSFGELLPLIYKVDENTKFAYKIDCDRFNAMDSIDPKDDVFLYQSSESYVKRVSEVLGETARIIYQFKENSLTVSLFKMY